MQEMICSWRVILVAVQGSVSLIIHIRNFLMTTLVAWNGSTEMERMNCAVLVTIGSLWRRRFVHLRLTCRTLIHILALVKEQLRSGHVMVTSAEGCKADSVTDVGHMQISYRNRDPVKVAEHTQGGSRKE